jgi:hypothetical protein
MTEKRKVECVACLWRKGKSGSGPVGGVEMAKGEGEKIETASVRGRK